MANEKLTDWLFHGPVDYGIFAPPMDAQTAVDFLKRYLLGDDWYSVNPISTEQIHTEIVHEILLKYSRKYRKEWRKATKRNGGRRPMADKKRLIDANSLSDEVDKSKHNNPHPQGIVRVNHRNEHDHFLRMILDAPTVDAVEVVRCKECHNCSKSNWCNLLMMDVKSEWFCSHGKRRKNEHSM